MANSPALRRGRDRGRTGRKPAGRGPGRSGTQNGDHRTRARRWHLHQRGLHPDQDDGRQRERRLPRPPRGGVRRARRPRRGRHGRRSQAQAAHRRELPQRAASSASKTPRTSTSSGAKRASPARESWRCAWRAARSLGLTADNIFINVGARPGGVPVEGIDDVPALNSTTIMELGEVPGHLLVLGGGYVGVEFAQMFRRFGSEVTVVQRGLQLLSREDEDVAEAVAEVLREDGVDVLLETNAQSVSQDDGGIRLDRRWYRRGEHPHGLAPARRGRAPAEHGLAEPPTAGIEMDGRGLREGQRQARDERSRRLGPRRCQGRSGLHPHLLRRLQDHRDQPARRR